MRVLHVLTRDYRRGAEIFGLGLHEALRAAGHESSVVALAPAPPGHQPGGVPALGTAGTRDPRTLRALRRRTRAADVVVAHGSDTLLACRLALLRSPVPFVYVNIGDPLHWTASLSRRLRVRWMLAGAARVGAVAPSAVERLVNHLGIPAERVRFTGNGRDSSHFRPADPAERAAGRARWSLPPTAPVAVAVANLAAEKRLDVAVRAVGARPHWYLLVVGTGPREADLHALAHRAAPGRVVFTGELDDVRPALHAADVALLTSTTEGLPGALLEAAMTGLPVVATNVGFVPDLVLDGRTGVLVPVGDPQATANGLRRAQENRFEWGPAGRAHAVQLFDAPTVVERWTALLFEVSGPLVR